MIDAGSRIDELMEACRNEDYVLVVDPLIDQFYVPVYHLVMSILQDSDEADDIAQETFITAVQKLARYEVGTNIRAWLFTIAVNKCRDHLRKAKRRFAHIERLQGWFTTAFGNDSPEDAALRTETCTELWEVVNALGDKHRLPVILWFLHGLPIRQIAGILNISEGSVHSRLHYANRKLRKYVDQNGNSLEEDEEPTNKDFISWKSAFHTERYPTSQAQRGKFSGRASGQMR